MKNYTKSKKIDVINFKVKYGLDGVNVLCTLRRDMSDILI